eukprot:gb/GECG01016299.1/.p1 GENE.gb/GECG01016299.1/~~gb/GECG01016299.1/.p1  ORF type:complete len:651 (+),score=60.52 gb/GECG01016299.1/:1-1953(+)
MDPTNTNGSSSPAVGGAGAAAAASESSHYGATTSTPPHDIGQEDGQFDMERGSATEPEMVLAEATEKSGETAEDSGVEDPHQASGIKHELSPLQASLNIIKAIVGAGSFGLPYAFYNSGIALALTLMCLLATLSVYTAELLNYIDRALSKREVKHASVEEGFSRKVDLTYPDIAEKAFPTVSIRRVCCCQCFDGLCSRRRRRIPSESEVYADPGTDEYPRKTSWDTRKPHDKSEYDQETLLKAGVMQSDTAGGAPKPVGVRKCCATSIERSLFCLQRSSKCFPKACCRSIRESHSTSIKECGDGCGTVLCCCGSSVTASGEYQSYADSSLFRFIVYFGFIATSIGACSAYVDFIASTIPSVFPVLNQTYTVLLIFPLLVGLALIRSMRLLAFTSILGNLAISFGLLTVLVSGFVDKPDEKRSRTLEVTTLDTSVPLVGNIKGFFRAFGTIAFLFAVHIIVYPIMQSMKRRKDFGKTIIGTYTVVTVINGSFAVLSVLLFAGATSSNIVENLSAGIYADAVKLLLCVDLLFTVPIVLGAARFLIEDTVVPKFPETWDTHVRNIVRLVLTIIIATICFLIPSFANLVTLVGGVVNCLMGYILPPLIYIKIKRDEGALSWSSFLLHGLLVGVGIVAAVASLTVTSMDIVNGSA